MRKLSPLVRRHLAAQQMQNCDRADASLLLAFAERKLSRGERAVMLKHLAECPGCREVLSLSSGLSAPEAPSGAFFTGASSWWGWRLVASAAVVCVAILISVKVASRLRPSLHKSSAGVASSSTPVVIGAPPLSVPQAAFVSRQTDVGTVNPPVRPNKEKEVSRPRKENELAENSRVPSMPDGSRVPSLPDGSRVPAQPEQDAAASPAEGSSPLSLGLRTPDAERSYGSLPVTAGPAELQTTPPGPPPASPRLSVAAPATAPNTPRDRSVVPSSTFSAGGRAVAAQNALHAERNVERTAWSLEGSPTAGALRRSDDGGRTWRTVSVDQATRFYAVSAMGSNIWVGGAGGKLFHSVDGGDHWTATPVAGEDRILSGDVIGIDARGDRVRLKTNSGATWTTDDGGVHWRRE